MIPIFTPIMIMVFVCLKFPNYLGVKPNILISFFIGAYMLWFNYMEMEYVTFSNRTAGKR